MANKILFVILQFFIFVLLVSNAQAGTVTTLSLVEKDGQTTSNYPITFGHVFKDGDVSQYVQVRYNGVLLTTQCDVKTTYSSGKVRFAVISVVLPSISANSTNTIVLETASTTASSGYLDKTSILATNIEDEIRLTNISGSGYSGSLIADLNAQIAADTSPTYWLQGSVATEILVQDELNNSLDASWEVRYYPGTSFGPRISHSIENMNANYRGIVNYDVDIQAGIQTLNSRYTKSSLQHNENSRWRKVIWVGPEPPEAELHYDISYIISTGAIMSYDTSLTIPESEIASTYSAWNASNHDIMGNGNILKYFPTSGGRPDIGILPKYAVMYLLSMDNRMRDVMLNDGEMISSAPVHFREYDSNKTFYRHPISIDDRQTVWTKDDWVPRSSTAGTVSDRLPVAIGNYDSQYHGWIVDRAHQGSWAFIPYLITGEKYYIDEMYYWAAYNLSANDSNNDYGRAGSTGLIRDETRGEAWALRNIADAAAFAVDGDIEKAYFTDKINNNITLEWGTWSNKYPLHYWSVDTSGSKDNMTADVKYIDSPWMEDYMLISLVHAQQLGFNTSGIISWFRLFNEERFTALDANPYDGANYRFPALLNTDLPPATWAEYKIKFVTQLSSWTAPTTAEHDYKIIALAAARSAGNTGAATWIYNTLTSAGIDWDILATNPHWAIMQGPSPQPSFGKRYKYKSIIDN